MRATTGGLTNTNARCKRARSFKRMTIKAAELEDRGVLRVAGEEAATFLQGLLTNDVQEPGGRRGALRRAADAAGQDPVRFSCSSRARRIGAAFLIDCPAAQLGRSRQAARLLSPARQGDDNRRERRSGGGRVLGRAACGSAGRLRSTSIRATRGSAFARSCRAPRPPPSPAALDEYEAHRIRLGVPSGGVDFAYADIFPHDANLDLLHGVDFEKGCYVGQEVVSRMRHRGARASASSG